MTEQSISDGGNAPCQLKTGRVIQKTGMKSDKPSSNEQDTVVKEAPPIPTAEPAITNPIHPPEAVSFSPSPTSTTCQNIAIPVISGPGASDVTSLMTENNMPEPENAALALSATTANPLCLTGKKRNKSAERRKQLMQTLKHDSEQLTMYQIQLENYSPFTDKIKQSIEVWGSSAGCDGGEFAVRAIQIAKYCQTAGLNDPNATPEQRLAMATCLLKGSQTYDLYLGDPNGKPNWKLAFKNVLEQASAFFGLGSKEMLKKQERANRKAK